MCGLLAGGYTVCSVAETNTDRLIDIKHVGVIVPWIWIKGWLRSTIFKVTRSILLEQTNHTWAAWSSIEPCNEWCGGWAIASFEKPEEHIHISTDWQVSWVLIDTSCCLTYPAIVDIRQFWLSRDMFVSDVVSVNSSNNLICWTREGRQSRAAQQQSCNHWQ